MIAYLKDNFDEIWGFELLKEAEFVNKLHLLKVNLEKLSTIDGVTLDESLLRTEVEGLIET